MSSQKKSSRLEGKDLITIGIYTVIYVVIVMLVAMLGFIPIFIPLMAVLCPLIGGIPYMLYVTILTEQRFMKLTATLEQEQEANQKRLQDLMLMMRHSDEQENEVRTFIKEIRRYATIEELDEAVLNRLISKILVSEVKKIDGQKVQEVRIIYNFVGEIPEIIV